MRKSVLKATALLCLLALVLQLPLGAAARSMGDVQSEINQTKENMAGLLDQIAAGKNNRAAAQQALDEFQAEYDKAVALIDEQERLIELTGQDLQRKTDQLSDTRERIRGSQNLFVQRLRAIYEANSTNALMAAIFAVDSFSGYAQAEDAMRRIARQDTELLHSLDAEWDTYDAQRLELEAEIDNMNAQLDVLNENREWLAQKMEEAQQLIAWANLQIAASQQQYQQDQEKLETLEAELEKLFWESQNNGSQQGDGSTKYDGPLQWPVPGYTYISSHFGDPRENTRYHYGIDIPAPTETAIVAAAPGTVITAKWNWSYGNYIEIDHGGGMRTLYAHCNSLWVGVGTTVAKGDSIAGVGNTGDSYGAHLHFEVHDKGTRQNPIGSGYLNW